MSKDTKGVLVYLLITFGFAWAGWQILLPPMLPPPGATGWVQARQFMFVGGFTPMIAAFVVRKWVTREGFADAGLGLHLRRWPYYIIAYLFPWAVLLAIALQASLFGLAHPDFSLLDTARTVLPGIARRAGTSTGIVAYLAFVALVQSPLAFGEEFGWRGYLQMRLFPSRPVAAAVATGLIWALWHLPIILHGGELPGNRLVSFLMFCVFTVLVAIILSWLRLRSGSVWVTCVAHSTVDAVLGILSILVFFNSGNPNYVWGAGVLSWIPLGLFCAWIIWSGQLNSPAKRSA